MKFHYSWKDWFESRWRQVLLCQGPHQWRSQKAEKLRTSKRDYSMKQWFSLIASLFKTGTSLKGKNLLPEGANSFLYDQYLIVWKITFITLSDLPWMLLFLLRRCATCVMGATPMHIVCLFFYKKTCKSTYIYLAISWCCPWNPESFARGGPTLTTFFF